MKKQARTFSRDASAILVVPWDRGYGLRNDVRLRESDFYGIEVARHLFDICQQRKHNGEFTNPFVFFSQRNAVTGLVFDRASMNTIHTSSLTRDRVVRKSRRAVAVYRQSL